MFVDNGTHMPIDLCIVELLKSNKNFYTVPALIGEKKVRVSKEMLK